MVINLDIPWNPAVLEQRIARVYRLGQGSPVQVINLVAAGTIEHRILDLLQFKSGLAAGVLDAAEDSVFMSDRQHGKFMESVEEINKAMQENKTTLVVTSDTDWEEEAAPGPAAAEEEDFRLDDASPEPETQEPPQQPATEPGRSEPSNGKEKSRPPRQPSAAGALVEQGAAFFSGLTQTLSDPQRTRELVEAITETDAETGQSYLKIPVENKEVVQNALKLLGALFGKNG